MTQAPESDRGTPEIEEGKDAISFSFLSLPNATKNTAVPKSPYKPNAKASLGGPKEDIVYREDTGEHPSKKDLRTGKGGQISDSKDTTVVRKGWYCLIKAGYRKIEEKDEGTPKKARWVAAGEREEASVEEAFACCRATQAGDTIHAADFSLKLVVIRQLFVCQLVSLTI